jgi:hypothetical protein
MSKMKGLKFTHEVSGQDKKTIAAMTPELATKLASKFPMIVSVGKGKEKVSLTIGLNL